MSYRKTALKIAIAVFICLLAVACGGAGAETSSSDTGPREIADADALYAYVSDALDDAYRKLGKPSVDWDNMERVKDDAFEALTSDASDMPSGSSWSISVMSDHIAIFAHLDGAEKSGDWRP